MAICDTCGNDYDKAFTITRGDQSATFDSLSAPSMPWLRPVPTAAAGSSDTAPRAGESCTAAPTALAAPVTPEPLTEASTRFPLYAAES